MPQPAIKFGSKANQAVVSVHTLGVLTQILNAANLDSCLITSTSRTPSDQARIMYDNIVSKGVAAQKSLYKAPGKAVIDEYVKAKAAGQGSDQIKAAMEARIRSLGPANVSHHCADPAILNVVDISPSSLSDKATFEKATRAAQANGAVSKFLTPGNNDPAYHLEIPQPKSVA
ncbi:MAG TPA: hypothetical protein VEZ40_10210 [Pyrinomonadaceae bacterium]|nr:hypothetical protein [Pyrinomonadaceae bacterium]